MRFLFFNLVVALALIYLFGDQHPEIQAAGKKAGQAMEQVKSMAASALDQGHAAAPAEIKPEHKSPPAVKPKPAPKSERLPAPQPQVMPAMVPPAPRPLVEVQTLNEPAAEPANKQAVQIAASAKPKPAPEVAKRRAVVLSGGSGAIATAPETQSVEISEDGRLMTATERRRALYRLAEEMELFSAGAAIPRATIQ